MAIHPYISLFSGAGGLDLAVRLALPEAQCLCYVENEITAARILAARIEEGSLDDAPIWSDVRRFPSDLFRGRVAGIVGGFSCPDYSVAGRRKGISGKHGQLWHAMREVIRMVEPEWVFLENVPGILYPHKISRWREVGRDLFDRTVWSQYRVPAGIGFVLGDLAAMGFDIEWGCLPASAVGASHKRERWFALAGRAGLLREPSGGDGLPDGCGEAVDNATGTRSSGRQPRSSGQIWDEARRAESGRRCDAVGCRWCGHAEHWHDRQYGCGEDGCSCERFAVGDATCAGREGSRLSGERQLPEESGCGMDNRPQQPSGELGHPTSAGLEVGGCEHGNVGAQREAAARAGADVEYPASIGPRDNARWAEVVSAAGSGRDVDLGYETPESGYSLGIFAPGPADPRWQDVLVRNFGLRPALAQAEVEQHFRQLADGLADLLVSSRADALRACGNGVVAIQGAAMLRELIRRGAEVTRMGEGKESESMRATSIYVFECVCGKTVKSSTSSAVCASCGRAAVIHWPAEVQCGPEPKTISERYGEK